MRIKFHPKRVGLLLFFTSNLVMFQNCSPGFKSTHISQNDSSSTAAPQSLRIESPAASSYVVDSATIAGSCAAGSVVEISGDVASPVSAVCTNGGFSTNVQISPADGMKTIRIQQTGPRGVISADARSFQRDTTAPALSVLTPSASSAAGSSVMFQGLCEAGAMVTIVEMGRAAVLAACDSNGVFSSNMTLSSGDGNIVVTVSQSDAAGNKAQIVRSINKDTTAPALSVTAPTANSNVQNGFALSGTCESGLMVEIGGAGTASPISVACNAGVFSGAVNLTAGNGAKTVSITQTDAVGNKGSATRSFNRLDTVAAPTVAISAPAANTVTKSAIALQGTCTNGLAVVINGAGVASAMNAVCTNGAFSANVVLSPGDGSKNVVVTQTNQGVSGISSRNFVLDTTAPALTLMSPAAGSVVMASVTLTGTCESGLPIAISGAGAAAALNAVCANGAFNQSVNLSNGDGSKTISLTQTDAAGNATAISRAFVRDSAAPTLVITAPGANTSAATGLTITGTCEGTFAVTASGAGVAAPVSKACAANAFSLDITFSNGDGNKAVTVSQTDAAGNTASVTRGFIRATSTPVLDGVALYAQNCAGCHGALATSSKIGRSAAQITAAFSSVPSMSGLMNLSSAQVSAIAAALAPPTVKVSRFQCVPGSDPAASKLQRLSKREYTRTLQDLFGASVNAVSLAAADVAGVPEEDATLYDTLNLSMTAGHTSAYFEVSDTVSAAVVANTNFLTAIGTSCLAVATPTQACIDAFITNFGLKAFRRPLTAAEITTYKNLYATVNGTDGVKAGIRVLLVGFLNSPRFLYRVEDQGTLVTGRTDLYQISPYEIASRLSYFALGSMPDAALFQAAADGSLNTAAGLAAQVTRLLSSPQIKETSREFFAQWLRLKTLPSVNYPAAYVSDLQDLPNLKNSMMQDFGDFVDYVTWTAKGNYQTLMTSSVAVVRTPDMAKIYGVGSVSAQPVTINAATRSGLLTRPIFLMAGNEAANPFHRGATVLRRVLCNNIPSPDPNAVPGALVPPPADPTKTSRERFALKTSPASCAGCHGTINPIGFSLESFDSIGRFRTVERIFDSTGTQVNQLPVDSSGVVMIDGVAKQVNNGMDLSAQVATSAQGPQCLVENFQSFVTGRTVAAADGCQMLRMEQALTGSGGSLQKMISAVTEGNEFRLRKVNP